MSGGQGICLTPYKMDWQSGKDLPGLIRKVFLISERVTGFEPVNVSLGS